MNRGPDPEMTDAELVRLVAAHPDPVVTAAEITPKTPYTAQNTTKRLSSLVDRDWLHDKSPGCGSRVYWTTKCGRQAAYDSLGQ
jgi:hypothetical protein